MRVVRVTKNDGGSQDVMLDIEVWGPSCFPSGAVPFLGMGVKLSSSSHIGTHRPT